MRRLKTGLLTLLATACVALSCTVAASAAAPAAAASSRQVQRTHRTQPRSSTSIVGGQAAAQGTWPFMAFVAHFDGSGNPQFACSGTVISPNLVLTAGHCGIDESTGAPLDPSGYRVVTASLDWTDTSRRQVSAVSRLAVYPSYDPGTKDSDAALLVLSTPTSAPAIRLAGGADQSLIAAGKSAFIAGWGLTSSGSPPPQGLRWAPTVIQNAQWCGQHISIFDSATELCTFDYPYDSTGACSGDSGGPLVAGASDGTPVEVGITSFGPVGCDTTFPNAFTRTDRIASWAAAWIAAAASGSTPPASAVAQPRLPTMTLRQARSYTHQTLAGAFHRRFKSGHRYSAHCHRGSSVRFQCNVAWYYGPNDYFGRVTVYFVSGSASGVKWTNRYLIRWVNDRCYFHSGHRARCRRRTARGSW